MSVLNSSTPNTSILIVFDEGYFNQRVIQELNHQLSEKGYRVSFLRGLNLSHSFQVFDLNNLPESDKDRIIATCMEAKLLGVAQ